MREIPCYQVDAFTTKVFEGNPAAVCPLDAWLPEATMLAIANENALSETAFFVRKDAGYELRWFTPEVEVDLCGHATLATAFVIATELGGNETRLRFETRSGRLEVERAGDDYVLDFPARPARPAPELLDAAERAFGARPIETWQTDALFAIFEHASIVRSLRPDPRAIAKLDARSAGVTAKGDGADGDVDFVSRYFAPKAGIDEDPVTGSAHCTLAPLWAEKLGKSTLRARQVSRRGGELACTWMGDRVHLKGRAVLVKRGVFLVP